MTYISNTFAPLKIITAKNCFFFDAAAADLMKNEGGT